MPDASYHCCCCLLCVWELIYECLLWFSTSLTHPFHLLAFFFKAILAYYKHFSHRRSQVYPWQPLTGVDFFFFLTPDSVRQTVTHSCWMTFPLHLSNLCLLRCQHGTLSAPSPQSTRAKTWHQEPTTAPTFTRFLVVVWHFRSRSNSLTERATSPPPPPPPLLPPFKGDKLCIQMLHCADAQQSYFYSA